MVNVECTGCGAPYSVSEKRIPAKGLNMRCPKCGTTFLVEKPGGGGAEPPGPRRQAGTALGHAPP
ncbi:MAG: zinc-ribbon domain-containing protein, partial [Myxococcota bacterium]